MSALITVPWALNATKPLASATCSINIFSYYTTLPVACECSDYGSLGIECDQTTGQCQCLPYVTGRDCSECHVGYWDIESERGCRACNCDYVGSTDLQCNGTTGQCPCKPGVEGAYCDECRYDHYGFGYSGCTGMCMIQVWYVNLSQCKCKPDLLIDFSDVDKSQGSNPICWFNINNKLILLGYNWLEDMHIVVIFSFYCK